MLDSKPSGLLQKTIITEAIRTQYLACDMCGRDLVVGQMCYIDISAGLILHGRKAAITDNLSCKLKYIYSVLHSHPKISAANLTVTLAVSSRTLKRYKSELRSSGYKV